MRYIIFMKDDCPYCVDAIELLKSKGLSYNSIVFNEDQDNILSEEDLIVLRPCPKDAIQPYQLDLVIGKKLKIDLIEGDYLRWKDIE